MKKRGGYLSITNQAMIPSYANEASRMSFSDDSDRLLSRDEVEQRFGISKRFLELAIAKRNGPRFVRIGSLVRYTVKDIRGWIAENTHETDK